MKKRLRKKLHREEFRELGFSFEAKFKDDTDLKQVEIWLQELADVLHARGLEMGGGWNSDVCGGFITRGPGSVTVEERETILAWFAKHDQQLDRITIGELRDAWYGW